ncbi:MAG: PAS domain-containing protein, partial [Rhodospirillales bacterium]
MIEMIWDFFDSAGLMPHGVCFLWREDLVYLHFFSDLAITGAYLSLPVFLIALVRRKPELKTGGIVPLFALFIFFCALTHMFSMWTLWVPDYLAQGVAKFATAVVSVFTAIMVWPLLPKLAAMPSTRQLMNSNRNLDENRAFLNVVLDSVEDGIVACDADGNLKIFNRKTRELHGLPAAPLPPEKWTEYYDLYEADGTTPLEMERIPLFRALRGEAVQNAEMVIRAKGCPPRQLLATGRALTDADGQKLGAVVSMHDITEQRNAEAARELAEEALRRTQRMEAIGQMTGGIA